MGYRKVGFLEQILYVIEAALRIRGEWIFGSNEKERKDG